MIVVIKICLVLLSFLVLIKSTVIIPGPNVTIRCTEHGFKPEITQTYVTDTEVYFDVALGDGSEGCNATSNVNASGDGSEVIGVPQLIPNANGDEIPYERLGGIACGGSLASNADNTSIEFALGTEVIVTQVLRKVIKRQQKFEFNLKCILTRDAGVVSSQGAWKISSELERTGNVEARNETFTLDTKLEFFKSNNYTDPQDTEYQLKAGERLYVMISEVNANTYFKFVVNKCWSTPNSSATFAIKDIFFDKGCPIDTTMTFEDAETPDDNHYKFSMQAFFFSIGKELAIYVHCELYICQSDEEGAMCTQPDKADCDARKGGETRRRRSVNDEPIEQVTVSSQQHILFDNSEIYAPTCAEGYVYDRMSKECTKQNVFEIRGVYLDIHWNPLYANTSSKAFAEFAKVKAYQLYALVQSATTEGVIHGIKVVKATKGSVILGILVKYADTSDSQTAFEEFEKALRTTRVTASRVLDILNIKQRSLKSIEYVPIMATARSKMNVTLLVVIVVLLVVVLISGITFYKVKQLRSPTATTSTTSTTITKDVNGFDNKAMDNMS